MKKNKNVPGHYRFKRFARKAYAAFNSMHKVVTIGVISGTMLTFANTAEASSEVKTSVARDSIPEQELDEMVVSSTKSGLPMSQTARLVTVVTAKEIDRQPILSIQDILKSVVGLDVRQRGSNGVLAGISVRGGTFDQTAILLNGANLSNPQTAHYSLDLPINLSDIERIEVIEGPSTLLFGASAFAGGVNIITKKEKENTAYARVQGGMHGLLGAEARGTWATKASTHSLSLGYDRSDGYIANSDYEIFNAFWQSQWTIEKNKIDLQAGYNQKEYGANTFYSPAYPNQFDETQSLFASLKGESGGIVKFTPHLYWSRHYDDFHLFRPGTPDIPSWYTAPNHHISDVFGFTLNSEYQWKYGRLNFGGEARNEVIRSSNLGLLVDEGSKYSHKDSRTNVSYFLENTFLFDRLSLSLGLLANYNTSFSNDFSFYPSLNASYWITPSLKAFASWNTSTRMPTFTDLYYTGATHLGNPDAQPETSSSVELGWAYRSGPFSAELNGFYLKGENMIDWVKQNPEDKWETRNLTDIERFGVEAEASYTYRSSTLRLAYLFMHQEKEATGWISNYVLDYLRHKFTVGLSHPIYKGLTADWQFRWQDRAGTYTKYDPSGSVETEYPSFCLLDLKLNYSLKRWNLFLTLNNLLDREYYDLGNIPQPGFWFSGGLSMKF